MHDLKERFIARLISTWFKTNPQDASYKILSKESLAKYREGSRGCDSCATGVLNAIVVVIVAVESLIAVAPRRFQFLNPGSQVVNLQERLQIEVGHGGQSYWTRFRGWGYMFQQRETRGGALPIR
ncbi:hypothetical protein SK128_020894, partial [Halocaridina rubra]